jgi:hypothetical protein
MIRELEREESTNASLATLVSKAGLTSGFVFLHACEFYNRRGGFMPGWGTGSFENEDAQKFLSELKSLRLDDLRPLLERAADQEDYLETRESSVAVAAAEVIAALAGPAEGQPEYSAPAQIANWVEQNKSASAVELSELRQLSLRAVDRVRTNSELKDLWLEAEGLNEWSAALRDLERRLKP